MTSINDLDFIPNILRPVDKWKILIVDDDQEVHKVTKLALRRFIFQDKPVEFISAYSAAEAISIIKSQFDIAVILLDVVMEEKDSGLKVVEWIRDKLQNNLVRIILRTGQPGEAPEESVILNYGINDYKTKSELTRQKLFTTIVTALKSYNDLIVIERHRQELTNLYEDLHQSHAQLQQAQENEALANRAKIDFLRVMNHELRTPLNGIVGMSDVLSEEVYGSLSEGQRKTVSTLKRSSHHLLDLVNNILEFVNIQIETLELKPKEVKVAVICQEAMQVIEPIAVRKNIQISVEVDERFLIIADPLRLKQILINLLDNAVKFTPVGGQIGLRVLKSVTEQKVDFIIWDTGIGFDVDNVEGLLKPFTQADSSNTRYHEGIGMGLALVDRLVKMHNGEIFVESKINQGSQFTISLPHHSD